MNQIFLVIGATLCYVGGFGIMIYLLGVLTELCIEIWDSNFRQICVRFQIAPGDVSYFAQSKKDIEAALEKQRIRWPNMDDASFGWWNCPECNTPNRYASESKPVAYCRCCGQAVDMDYYRRHADDSHTDT